MTVIKLAIVNREFINASFVDVGRKGAKINAKIISGTIGVMGKLFLVICRTSFRYMHPEPPIHFHLDTMFHKLTQVDRS